MTANPSARDLAKAERLAAANQFLVAISESGRNFFRHDGRVSRFEFGARGHIWLVDSYTQKRVYVAYAGRWRGFTGGGTLRNLIERLATYIRTGEQIGTGGGYLGPWPEWICRGDLWGYGDDMATVREAARRLGVIGVREVPA